MNPFTRYMKDSNEPQQEGSSQPVANSSAQAKGQEPAGSSTRSAGGRNILSADVEIKGKINFTNDLVVDGKIEGEIISDGSLTVGENARIRAEIRTRSVVIYGKVYGNISVSERVELKKDAELVGDIKAGTISIEAGAIFVGNSTVGTPTEKPAPLTTPAPVRKSKAAEKPSAVTSSIPAPKKKQEEKQEDVKIDPAMAAMASRSMPLQKKKVNSAPVSASQSLGGPSKVTKPISSLSSPPSSPSSRPSAPPKK